MGKEKQKHILKQQQDDDEDKNKMTTTTTTTTDWGQSDKSHVEHAVGTTVCIKVPKLREQE